MSCKKNKITQQARQDYPGAAVDAADDNRVDAKMVKQRVHIQNDNPRSNEGPRPLDAQ